MIFKEGKPIYVQIADHIGDEILCGNYAEEGRIPSVREYAAMVEVNANTTMRAYEFLQGMDVIYMKRGIGYFVSNGARQRLLQLRKTQFLNETVYTFFHEIHTLGISMDEIAERYRQYIAEKKNKGNNNENKPTKL